MINSSYILIFRLTFAISFFIKKIPLHTYAQLSMWNPYPYCSANLLSIYITILIIMGGYGL